jgi:hypothetical protein
VLFRLADQSERHFLDVLDVRYVRRVQIVPEPSRLLRIANRESKSIVAPVQHAGIHQGPRAICEFLRAYSKSATNRRWNSLQHSEPRATVHDFNLFLSQLERGRFKAELVAGLHSQHGKANID